MKKLFITLLLIFLASCTTWDKPTNWITTRDQCKLPLFTYPTAQSLSTGIAILYLHGLGANHNNFNPIPSKSFALKLARKGFYGFAIDFRGHGAAKCKDPRRETIGNLWRYDLPALIKYVYQKGFHKFFLMGHSLGGITALEYGAHVITSGLLGIVAIGAPVTFTTWQAKKILPLIKLIDLLKPISWWAWSFPANYLAGPFVGIGLKHLSLVKLFGNPQNIDPAEAKIMLKRAVSPRTPIIMIDQLRDALKHGPLIDSYGTNYLTALKNLHYPILFICGTLDNMSPCSVVKMSYNYTASRDKTLIIAGKKYGFKYNYGHIDLVVGKIADREILPRIEEWLKNHHEQRFNIGGGDRIRTGE